MEQRLKIDLHVRQCRAGGK